MNYFVFLFAQVFTVYVTVIMVIIGNVSGLYCSQRSNRRRQNVNYLMKSFVWHVVPPGAHSSNDRVTHIKEAKTRQALHINPLLCECWATDCACWPNIELTTAQSLVIAAKTLAGGRREQFVEPPLNQSPIVNSQRPERSVVIFCRIILPAHAQ